MLRFAKLSAVILSLASLAASAFAGDMQSFLDAKEAGKKPVTQTAKTAADESRPAIASKQQLAAAYTKYHSNFDCAGLKSLVNWEGVDFWRKEEFGNELCHNGYKDIDAISFVPVDTAKLVTADEKGQARVYTLPPVATMVVKFKPQKYARSTAPGDSPKLEFMVAQDKTGSFVLVTTKRKAN